MHRVFKYTSFKQTGTMLAWSGAAALAALLTLSGPMPAQADPRFDACMARCAPEDAYHCSLWCGTAYSAWKWRQQQSGGQTSGEQSARRPKQRSAKASFKQVELSKSLFSGSEARISAMHSVKADCSSGLLPEVRIVTKPASGEVRLEPFKLVVSQNAKHPRAHCNGKTVDAVGVHYKSKEQFVGTDKMVLDVDFRNGGVNRYTYAIDVR